MSEQIKRAKAFFEYKSENYNYMTNVERDMYLTVNQVLQAELERQENKALSLEQLRDMVGEPVWVECEEPHWIVIENIHLTEDCLNIMATNNTWYTNIEVKFDVVCQFDGVDNCEFYKHKPMEE